MPGAFRDAKMVSLQHAGAHCDEATKREAIQRFGPIVHEFYGTSHGVIAEISSADWLRHPGSVGKPLPGLAVTIANPDSDGHGEICVTGRQQGNEPTAIATGDLGRLESDYLYVTGRLDEDLGPKYSHLEAAIRRLTGVTDVAILGANGVTCLIEAPEYGNVAAIQQAVETLAKNKNIRVEQIRIAVPGAFIRTESGKLRRIFDASTTKPQRGR